MEILIKVDAAPALMRVLERIAGFCSVERSEPMELSSSGTLAMPTEAPSSELSPKVEEEKPVTPEAPKEETAPITDEELRQQMDIVISKFAGNGWKDKTDSRTQAIKKGCTASFKEIAKWLGAEKPTALDDIKRGEFVKRLSEIFIEEEKGKAPSIVFRPF